MRGGRSVSKCLLLRCVGLPTADRSATIFPASSHSLESVRKEVGEFSPMHADCIRTGKRSGGTFASGMLRRQEITMQGACAQPPDPSWAGRREHSKVLIQPA